MDALPKFRLRAFAAGRVKLEVDFNALNQSGAELDHRLDYHYAPYIVQQDEPAVFLIRFVVDLKGAAYTLELVYYAWFEVEGPLPDDFGTSDWVMINAPAIAYPYVRAYVSQLTMLSGLQPVLLPVINFVEAARGMRESSSEEGET